jgi:hypothetical protein
MDSMQWDDIEGYIFQIARIQHIAIDNSDKELYDTCRHELEYIAKEISWNDFPALGNYQEANLIIVIIRLQTENAIEAADSLFSKEAFRTFSIDTNLISDLIEKEKFYVDRIMKAISDFIIVSQRKERLDYYASLNYWAALGRRISKIYLSNKTAHRSMWFILDTMDVLKKEIEANQLPQQKKNYDELKKQYESLKTGLTKDNPEKEIDVLPRIEKTLGEFQDVQGESDYDIVKWPQ